MLFLTVLIVATAIASFVGRRRATWRDHLRRGLGVALIVAGASHLVRPEPFLQHLPDWMPLRDATVAVTGVIEIIFGLLLYGNVRFRREIGLALAVYLVSVFPANVYVALEGIDVEGQPDGPYPWLRLPLQAVFVFIAWWSTRTSELDRAPDASPAHPSAVQGARRDPNIIADPTGRNPYSRT